MPDARQPSPTDLPVVRMPGEAEVDYYLRLAKVLLGERIKEQNMTPEEVASALRETEWYKRQKKITDDLERGIWPS